MNRLSKLPMVLITGAVVVNNLSYVFSWLGTDVFSRIAFAFVNLLCLCLVCFYYFSWKWAMEDCDDVVELLRKCLKEKSNASKGS